MNDLIQAVEAAEKACFEVSHSLRSQIGVECLRDEKNDIMKSIARTRIALQKAIEALTKAGK